LLDLDSFVGLLSESYQRCWLIAAAVTGDRVEADDIVQEASLVALRKRGEFNEGTNFPGWIAQIVRLTALNYSKKSVRRSVVMTDPAMIDHATPERSSNSPASHPVTADGQLVDFQSAFDDDVVLALSEISNEARACLLLRVVQQLSYEEIASTLRIPEGTAMSHVHRAKQWMRLRIEELQSQTKDLAKHRGHHS
jgi:RNA polymerase sigma-70 factor (ECF subfamily)